MKRHAAALAAIALMLLLTACGGGDDDPASNGGRGTIVPPGDGGGATASPTGDGKTVVPSSNEAAATTLPAVDGEDAERPNGDGGDTEGPNGDDEDPGRPNRNNRPAMHLSVDGGECDQPDRPTSCRLLIGARFTLSVNASVRPANGYMLAATYVDFGDDLIYNQAESPSDEMVWPDCEPAALLSSQESSAVVNHGCISGLIDLIASTYVGNLVDLSFTCSSEPSSTLVELVPYGPAQSDGSLYVEFGSVSQIVPELSNLTISCVPPTQN